MLSGITPGMSALAPALLHDPVENIRMMPGMTKEAALGTAKSLPSSDARELYDKASTEEELKLKNIANEFVSVLQSMIYKKMDAGIERTGLISGGAMEETFRPMLFDEYSKIGSNQRGNMLSHRVYEMLYNNTIAVRKPSTPAQG